MFKRNKKNFFSGPLWLTFILLVVLGCLAGPLSSNFLRKQKVDSEILELQKEISRLDSSNKDLEKLLVYLKSDQFAEVQARVNFGLKKPGEEVVVIKSGENSKEIEAAGAEEGKNSNPVKWLKYFLKMKQ
jgi:cell division protein FtsB